MRLNLPWRTALWKIRVAACVTNIPGDSSRNRNKTFGHFPWRKTRRFQRLRVRHRQCRCWINSKQFGNLKKTQLERTKATLRQTNNNDDVIVTWFSFLPKRRGSPRAHTHSYLCRRRPQSAALEMRLLAGWQGFFTSSRLTQFIFLVRGGAGSQLLSFPREAARVSRIL